MKIEYKTHYDLEFGFFWVIFDSGKQLQGCLAARKDGKGYRKAVTARDTGFDDGICGDVNANVIDDIGREEALALLLKAARKMGLRVEY